MRKIILLLSIGLSVGIAFAIVGCDSNSDVSSNSSFMPPSEANGFADYTAVIHRQAPTVMLHQHENYYPIDIDTYLNKSTGLYAFGNLSSYPPNQLNRDKIAKINNTDWGQAYVLAPAPDSVKAGRKSEPTKWTAYVSVGRVTITAGKDKGDYLFAQYNTFYAYNTFSQYFAVDGDYHFADWERVSVIWKFDKPSPDHWKILAVLTKAHTEDSVMTKSNAFSRDGSRVKVWAAQNSHGTHPDTGDFGNCGKGLSIDQCGDGGTKWDMTKSPIEVVQHREYTLNSNNFVTYADYSTAGGKRNPPTMVLSPWLHFSGLWGQMRAPNCTTFDLTQIICSDKTGDSPGTYLSLSSPPRIIDATHKNTSEVSFLSKYLLEEGKGVSP